MAESREVAPELKARFAAWIDARTAKGVDTYGGPLKTHNGRDAQLDMVEELLDFCQYQQQRIIELEDELASEKDEHADTQHWLERANASILDWRVSRPRRPPARRKGLG